MRIHIYHIIVALLFVAFGMTSCIEPPLHLPGQNMELQIPQVETDLEVIWDVDVDFQTDWYYGWDLKDDSIWGSIGYTMPTSFEVHRYFKGDDPYAKHTTDEAFSIRTTRFRRYFQFGYYDMLFYSDIDSKDGTQVLVLNETLDSVTATTTGTRGISRSILEHSRSNEADPSGVIGLLNQPEIFYSAYPENIYISRDLSDYEFDPVENIYIKDFKCKLYSDNALANNTEENDLVYMSNANIQATREADEFDFKFNTALTSNEALSKGISTTSKLSNVIDLYNNTVITSLKNVVTNETGKAEELFINDLYNEYSTPKLIIITSLDYNNTDFWKHYQFSYLSGKRFYPISQIINCKRDSVQYNLKQI